MRVYLILHLEGFFMLQYTVFQNLEHIYDTGYNYI